MKKSLLALLVALMIGGLVNIASAVPIEDLKVDISGLGQWGYQVSQINGNDDGFDTNRLRIKIGAQPAENVKFYAAIEGTNNASAMAAGSQVPANANIADGTADSRLVDMYVTLTYLEWVTVLIGQMPTPVSYELNTDEYDLETINYSQFVGIGNRDRGVGLIIPLHPELNLLTWVLNGNGSITGANDNPDDRYAYGAMLEYKPYKEFKIKLFGHFNDVDSGAIVAGSDADVDAWGGGLDYKWYGFRLTSEYAHAKLKMTNAAGVSIGTPKTEEWYVHGSYLIPRTDLQVVARYDRYDPDTTSGATNDLTKITTIGLNWNFEKDCRLQLDHQFMKRDFIPAGVGSDRNADQTDVQLSVRF